MCAKHVVGYALCFEAGGVFYYATKDKANAERQRLGGTVKIVTQGACSLKRANPPKPACCGRHGGCKG